MAPNTAPPSTITLLHLLRNHPHNTKVRFLGCITNYDPATSTLSLSHHLSSEKLPTIHLAKVNISIPLPLLDIGTLKYGEWVNVIGYIQKKDDAKNVVYVDALHIWSVGPGGIHLVRYEKALKERIEPERAKA